MKTSFVMIIKLLGNMQAAHRIILLFVCLAAITCLMAYRHHHHRGHGNGQHAGPLDGEFGQANTCIPPSWRPDEDRYPFRNYEQDLLLWSAATDIDEARRAPAAVLRLTGGARFVARD